MSRENSYLLITYTYSCGSGCGTRETSLSAVDWLIKNKRRFIFNSGGEVVRITGELTDLSETWEEFPMIMNTVQISKEEYNKFREAREVLHNV